MLPHSWRPVVAAGLVLALIGCQSSPPPPDDTAPPPDSFGVSDEDIEAQIVQQEMMLRQRAQLELRLGGAFPFDLFAPGDDALTDPALLLGTKFNFEVFKDLYLGFTFDWAHHDVQTPSSPASTQPIQFLESYDRYAFLLGMDYDIPLTDDVLPVMFRVGGGLGMLFIDPDSRFGGAQRVQRDFGFVFRPSVGIRYPTSENVILFAEGSLDLVPTIPLDTVEDQRIQGADPIFGNGALWIGVAFQWY